MVVSAGIQRVGWTSVRLLQRSRASRVRSPRGRRWNFTPIVMTDHQKAQVSELIARYFMGWKRKKIGERRFRRIENLIEQILEGTYEVEDEK